MMSQDMGSKRRVRRVRWTHGEIVTAVLLFLVLATEATMVTLWVMGHPFD
jgi:hypothetical protein